VVLFVNGLPLAVLELKNAAARRDDLDRLPAAPDLQGRDPVAVRQQRVLVISDGVEARVGHAHRRARVVQALAHDLRARRWPTRTCRSCRW
jgi:type I site-specific restriction-modification system R (restriction) subunit